MRRTIVVSLGLAAAVAALSPVAAAPFTGKPPIIGDQPILAEAVALDAAGAKYVTGLFYAIADFNPGTGLQNRTAHGPGGTPYVTKFDAAGNWVWTQTFGGTGTDQAAAIAVAGGIVYVVGTFDSNDAGFGGLGTISANTNATNFGAGFVIALDAATGAAKSTFHGAVGANTFGGSGGGRASATTITVDGSVLYIGGTFASAGFGIGGSGNTSSTGQNDAFVAALDVRSGEPVLTFGNLGLQTFGGDGNETIRGLAASGGALYVAGDTSSTNFGLGGTGTLSTPALNNVDAFVAALDATGSAVAAFGGDGFVTFGGAGAEEARGVAVGGGAAYLVGTANGLDAKIDGAGASFPTFGARDVFVMSVDAATGAPRVPFAGGVRMFGGVQSEGQPTAVAATASAVYVAGALGTELAGIGGAGDVEKADAYVLALDASNAQALPGFAGDGVQTINGGDPQGNHQTALINGMAYGGGLIALVGAAPVGTYFGAPAVKTKFPGVGSYLLLLDPLNGDARNLTGANRRPAFSTPIYASPNPAVAGKPVKLMAQASDPDRNALHFLWDLGDGTTSKSKAPSKKYAAAGTFTLGVTVDDGKGGDTAGTGLNLVVVPANTPYFDVTKATVALKYSTTGQDVVTAAGQIPLADGTSLAGKVFTLNVGNGAQKSFVLDATGRSPKGDSSVTVSPPKKGVAKFTAKIAHGDWHDVFFEEGMSDGNLSKRYAPTLVVVVFDGAAYSELMPLFWTAKIGRSGTAK